MNKKEEKKKLMSISQEKRYYKLACHGWKFEDGNVNRLLVSTDTM
jgi:hypothetical protein